MANSILTRKVADKSARDRFTDQPVEGGIVDILTSNWTEALVCLPDGTPIGINNVYGGRPVKFSLYCGAHERGLWNPAETDRYYLINVPDQQILVVPSKGLDLFQHKDQILPSLIYTWHGNVEEILKKFKQSEYSIENKMNGKGNEK